MFSHFQSIIGDNLNQSLSADLRTGALMVIMTRGGLGLDPNALRRLSFVVLRLAFCTAFVESVVVGLASMFLLSLPWGYAFMLGTIICASSPAVVVPCMLNLQERRLGTAKGVPTLIMAAASVDDVMAITAFGVLFGVTFAEGGLVTKLLSGPLQSIAGIVSGILIGCLFWYGAVGISSWQYDYRQCLKLWTSGPHGSYEFFFFLARLSTP